MCFPEPDDVQYDLSLYGCGKIIELNEFCVLFAVPSPLMLLSAIPSTVAHSQGGPIRQTFSETVNKWRTILTLPSVLSAVCIAQN